MSGGNADYTLFTDSSGSVGYGGVLDNKWFHRLWPDVHVFWKSLNIVVLERYPILVAISMWTDTLSSKVIEIRTDNAALVPIINKLYCKDPVVFRLMHPLALVCMKHNILLIAKHIPGKENIGADLLSRNKIPEFIRLFNNKDHAHTEVPLELLPTATKARYFVK